MSVTAVKQDYSLSHFSNDVSNFVTSSNGAKDTLDAVINACDWAAHLGIHKKLANETAATLNPLKQGFSFFGFFEQVNSLRDVYRLYAKGEGSETAKKAYDHSLIAINNASEAAMCLDATGLYRFKEGMKAIKTTFWSTILLLDTVGFAYDVGQIDNLRQKRDGAKIPEFKEVIDQKISNLSLGMLKRVTTLAMACIALVSILFASLAQGFLFNPVVMLGLSSAFLTLHFVTTFYDKIITHRMNQIPIKYFGANAG